MTIICLAMDIDDLKERLGRIIVGETCGHVRCAMSNAQCAPGNV
jgi:formyltetrahydrofolate synthetase